MGIPAEALLPFIFGSSGGGGGGGDSTYIPTFGSLATISTGTSWSGDDPYTSTVTVTGYTVTNKTMVNVLPSSDVVEQMIEDGTTNIFITNNSGTLTATAIGAAPTAAMTLQVLCTESDVSEDIAGLPAIVGDGIFDTLEANNLTDAVNQLSNAISEKAPVIINTASGDIASFADGADGMQIRKIVGTIVTPEGGSGWTGATIYHENQRAIFNLTGYIESNGNISPNTGYRLCDFYDVKDATSIYYHLFNTVGYYLKIAAYDANKSFMRFLKSTLLPSGENKVRDGTIDVTNVSYVRMCASVSNSDMWIASYHDSLVVDWENIAGTVATGTFTLNEDGSADVVNSGTGNSYHLTVVGSLTTLYGVNNIWIDTGAITECDYPADTKLYIDGLTEPDEDMIADGLIASGKYFTVNNQLYLSTAQIAAGAQIIPGSNCTATSITEALNALNS